MRIVKGAARKKNKQVNKAKRFLAFVECRLPGGIFYEQIAADLAEKEPFGRLMVDIVSFLAGNRISHSLFPALSVKKTGEYTADGFLYHITPVESIEAIRQKGIVPNNRFVFLTDDADYYINVSGYPDWKAKARRENTDFCVLKIHASSLRKQHKIFCIDREHEFVTETVEPEFIVFE